MAEPVTAAPATETTAEPVASDRGLADILADLPDEPAPAEEPGEADADEDTKPDVGTKPKPPKPEPTLFDGMV